MFRYLLIFSFLFVASAVCAQDPSRMDGQSRLRELEQKRWELIEQKYRQDKMLESYLQKGLLEIQDIQSDEEYLEARRAFFQEVNDKKSLIRKNFQKQSNAIRTEELKIKGIDSYQYGELKRKKDLERNRMTFLNKKARQDKLLKEDKFKVQQKKFSKKRHLKKSSPAVLDAKNKNIFYKYP